MSAVLQDALPGVIEYAPRAPLQPVKTFIWGLRGEGMALSLACGHWKQYPKRRRHTTQKRARCPRCSGQEASQHHE